MRGEVIHYDDNQGVGYISGDDGERYGFTRADMKQLVAIGKGTKVDFGRDGVNARDIFVIAGFGRAASASQPGTGPVGAPVSYAADPNDQALGLFAYFKRALTERYAMFRGRARRKEYWGFVLFATIALFALVAIGTGIDAALGNFDSANGFPLVLTALVGLLWLAIIVPGLAVTVRRLHDIGLSGWFVLLQLIPYIGGLIIFVMTLMPSQMNENKWGAIPAGIV
ncbi:MAG: DUF805 domain-containing protein [Phyllobacteriaceae bacterium]|nr:DUF805 domain-containing protein [Phyllobacteriaceae bacterium]